MFKSIQVERADAETINRFQSNVSEAFTALEASPSVPVQAVQFTATINSYAVKPTDLYLIVDSRGGPGKVVLPSPARATQVVSILNAYPPNAVSVVQANAGLLGNGASSIGLPALESAKMVCDGKRWFRFGV
jgi:hypothetical protein